VLGADVMCRFFWIVLVPLTIALVGTALVLVAIFGPPAHPPVDASLFLADRVRLCAPEPAEHLAYVLALVIPALVFCSGATAWPALSCTRFGRWCEECGWIAALIVRCVVSLFVVAMLIAQNRSVHAFLPLWPARWPAWLLLVGALLYRDKPDWVALFWRAVTTGGLPGRAGRLWCRYAPLVIAVFATASMMLPALYFDRSPAPMETMRWHLPFTLGEFAAVENGRTFDVDFYPQYQRVLAYMLLPFFRLFGLTVTAFTTAMALLSLVGLLSLYGLFRRLTRNPWSALMLYLPLLWVSVLPSTEFRQLQHQVDSSITYFAVGPIRYLGPFITALFLSIYLSHPSQNRLIALSFVAGLAAVNNFDFGLPALVGAGFAAWHSAEGTVFPGLRTGLRLIRGIALGTGAAFASYLALTYVRSGRLPNLTSVIQFQRAFAVHGFNMLPMPATGLHWVFYITFLAALARGLFGQREARLRNGSLLFAGIFGGGAMMYYVGRSHWSVLAALFPAWSLAFLLIAWTCWEDRPRVSCWTELPLRLGPVTCLVVYGYWQCLSAVGHVPSPIHQIARLSAPSSEEWIAPDRLTEFVRRNASPGEKVAVLHADGHLIATRAGVVNSFPFSHPASVILREQLALTMRHLRREGVQRVFGRPEAEVAAELHRHGFRRVGGPDDFELWERETIQAAARSRPGP
jgi:hypothetical protein